MNKHPELNIQYIFNEQCEGNIHEFMIFLEHRNTELSAEQYKELQIEISWNDFYRKIRDEWENVPYVYPD